jgi:hypothetical protein
VAARRSRAGRSTARLPQELVSGRRLRGQPRAGIVAPRCFCGLAVVWRPRTAAVRRPPAGRAVAAKPALLIVVFRFALATVPTGPDEPGGPPPQVLRATGQPLRRGDELLPTGAAEAADRTAASWRSLRRAGGRNPILRGTAGRRSQCRRRSAPTHSREVRWILASTGSRCARQVRHELVRRVSKAPRGRSPSGPARVRQCTQTLGGRGDISAGPRT